MAVPLTFRPSPIDPHLELQRRLAEAPREHAEALLVAYDILQTSHDKGILDLLHGMIGAKDTIFATLARYAKTPEGIAAIRNLLEGAKVLTAIDPEMLESLTKTMVSTMDQHKREVKTPGMFAILRRALSEDGRRGLSFATLLLTGLGKSLKG